MRTVPAVAAAALLAGTLVLPRRAGADEVLLFAAASLSDALEAITADFNDTTGDTLTCSFGASSDLARQISAGAPAEAFFSADAAKVDTLEAAGLVRKADRRDVLSNALVIVVPEGAPKAITSAADLKQVKHLALADPETVPAGIYAKQYLQAQGLWDAVKDHVVPATDVRAALAAVEGGHAEAGLVYKTDAAISKRVRIAVEVPRADGPKITYVLAPVAKAADQKPVARLIAYLTGPKAKAVYERFGFVVLPQN